VSVYADVNHVVLEGISAGTPYAEVNHEVLEGVAIQEASVLRLQHLVLEVITNPNTFFPRRRVMEEWFCPV
jgi:hypothetical protein